MVEYVITFDFDMDDILSIKDGDLDVEILEIDDTCFDKFFENEKNIRDFEEWYNYDEPESKKVLIVNINYDKSGEKTGILKVTTKTEIFYMNCFAKELVNYLFEEWPEVTYRVTGTSYRDTWSQTTGLHTQEDVDVDYEDTKTISSYNNLKIIKK